MKSEEKYDQAMVNVRQLIRLGKCMEKIMVRLTFFKKSAMTSTRKHNVNLYLWCQSQVHCTPIHHPDLDTIIFCCVI